MTVYRQRDVYKIILELLSDVDVCHVSQVNKAFHELVKDEYLWKRRTAIYLSPNLACQKEPSFTWKEWYITTLILRTLF